MVVLKALVSDIESDMRQKISQQRFEELEEKMKSVAEKSQIDSLESRMFQAEHSLASASKNFQAIDHAMSLKATIDQVKGMETDIKKISNDLRSGLEKTRLHESTLKEADKKLAEIESSLKDKANTRQVEEVRECLTGLQSGVSEISDGLKEKVCTNKLTSAAMGLQIQLTQIENTLQQKVDIERIQQLSSIASNFDMKVNNLEQSVQSSSSNVHRMEGKLAHLQEQIVRNTKAGARDVEAVGGSIASIEIKVRGIEHDVQSGANRMQAVEYATSQLQAKMKDVLASTCDGSTKLPHLEVAGAHGSGFAQQSMRHITHIQAQLASLEQVSQSKLGPHHLQQLEKSIAQVKEDITRLQHGVEHGSVRLQSVEAKLLLTGHESVQFQRNSHEAFTPRDRYSKAGSTRATAVNHGCGENISAETLRQQGEATSRSPRMSFKH
mmetsp:Transcript_44652/g.71368  ORF Transcript_44652/g.71368 Transcript_44652/m.71368 type:complete len:439 (+) Transcript_44652:2-1318(+)